ncbi:MAG: hypothetical protein CM1200mP2_10230 [Planctomycetaceae bacterium]|nr:MAG: hypothetical protein CM1200mP2_10230 [Planctomycetaceae bacterium]
MACSVTLHPQPGKFPYDAAQPTARTPRADLPSSAPTFTRPGHRSPNWSVTGDVRLRRIRRRIRPLDLYALENIGRAFDLFPHMSGMMKIEQEPRTYLTIRAIGSGIQKSVRRSADGRGCPGMRQGGAGRDPRQRRHPRRGDASGRGVCARGRSPEFAQALDQSVVALMIEKKSAWRTWKPCLGFPGVE